MTNRKQYQIFLSILALMMTAETSAQSTNSIAGEVRTRSDLPVEAATVLLVKAADTALVKATITGKEGLFKFENILPGQYLVKVSHVSGGQGFSKQILVANEKSVIQLETVYLTEIARDLGEVQVTAQKPFIELHTDRLVINVESASINAGNNAMEILERSPGITVDQLSGRIDINGKTGTLVMINGRPTYLSAADLAILLRSTPSNQLERIEIITNPPARYDAAGNAGIINLRLKRNEREGFNGSYTLSMAQGVYFKTSAGATLNYRRGKLNIYGSYNIQKRNDFTRIDFNRSFFQASPPFLSVQHSFRKFEVIPQNYNFGIDLFVNKNTTIGLLAKGFSTNFKSPQENMTRFIKANDQRDSAVKTIALTKEHSNNYSLNLNFKKVLDTAGREFQVDIDYSRFSKRNNQHFTSTYFDENNVQQPHVFILTGDVPSSVDIKSVKADYIHPLPGKARIEGGVKASSVTTDNFPQFFREINSSLEPDSSQTNHFIYKENIYAAYASFTKELVNTSLQVGLRGEYTDANGDQKISKEVFTRKYFQLFPTFFLQQRLSEDHTLSLSYGRRVDRPSYQDLNPYRLFLDQFSLWQGNPMLGPQFTNHIEVNHQYKKTFITKLNYTVSNKIITDIIRQIDSSKLSIRTKGNLNTFKNLGLTIITSFNHDNWYTGNFTANVFLNQYKGLYFNESFEKSLFAYIFNFTNSLRFSPQISADINGFYQSKNLVGLEETISKYSVSLGIRRVSKDRKTTIQLNVSDIFRGQRGGGITEIANLDSRSLVRFDSRVIRLSFTHRFGKTTVPSMRDRDTGVEDEKGRVNN